MSTRPDPRTLLELNPDGVFAVDADGTILYANPAGARLLDGDEPIGSTWRFELDSDHTVEIELPGGGVAEVHSVPATWQGAPAWLATVRNVTRRLEASREATRTQRELVAMSVEAGRAQLARAIVHSAGNVLNSVTVGMSTLEERLRELRIRTLGRVARRLRGDGSGPVGPAELARHADLLDALGAHLDGERDRLLDEVASLRDRVEHLRSLLQLEHAIGGPSLVELISFDEVVDAAVRAHDLGWERLDVRVQTRFGRVPDARIDRHQVLQIVSNLLLNAREALAQVPPGRRALEVTTAWDGAVATLTVTDTGTGFGPDVGSRLFQAGFTTKRDGLGYGLHASAVAIQALGGALRGWSAGPGRGATFTLTLPLARPTPG